MKWLLKLLGCKCEEKDAEINELTNDLIQLEKEMSIAQPIAVSLISRNDIYDILKNYCPVYLSDDMYNLTTVTEAKRFTNETKVAYKKWIKEDHDCDNFSFASMGYWSEGLKSFAYGIAWSANHAFNIMVDDKKNIWIIEPQTNEYMTFDQAKKIMNPKYFPLRVVMI